MAVTAAVANAPSDSVSTADAAVAAAAAAPVIEETTISDSVI